MKRTILLSLLLFYTLFVLYGCGKSEKQEGSGEKESTAALNVKVVPARIGNVTQTVLASGIIKGYREVPVAPGMSSWVTKILVKEGDNVKKGQLLAKLSPEQLQQAEAQFQAAQENFSRMRNLLEQGSISQQQFDQVEAAYKAARAMYELASKNTELRAPFSGVIASINTEEGEYFNAMMAIGSSPSVLTVIDQKKVKLEPGISEKDMAKIEKDQKAFLRTDAYPDTVFWGKVERIDQIADPMAGTYKVSVVFPNPDGKLRSGMYATVHIIVAEADSAVVIPQSAILNDTIVYIAEGNKARARKIYLGVQSDSLAQVLSGVEPGELVVTEGTLALFDGAPIVQKK